MTPLHFIFPGHPSLQIDGHVVAYGQDTYGSLSEAFRYQRPLVELWQSGLNRLDNAYYHSDIDYQDAEETEFNNPLFVLQQGIVLPPFETPVEGILSIQDDILLSFRHQHFVVLQENGQWLLGYQRDHHHADYDSYDLDAYYHALYWLRHYLPSFNLEQLRDKTDIYKPSTYQHYRLPAWTSEEHCARQHELLMLSDTLDLSGFLTDRTPPQANDGPLFW